jgi:high-affinity iron transporter
MLASLIIVFREVLEAGLIIGVVLAASRGVEGRGRAIALGVAGGAIGASIVAVFASRISAAFEGRGQELFTAGVLLLAVVMLGWHVAWMSVHARELTKKLRALGKEVIAGTQSVLVLGMVVAMAVLREGSEVVLFLAGIAMQGSESLATLVVGAIGGLALGGVVSAVVYAGLLAIPIGRVFSVTGALITLLAAGLAAQAVNQLSSAGLVNILDGELWDTSWLLSEGSWPGRVLHVLIGYMDKPTVLQGLVYLLTVAIIFLLARWSASTLQQQQA